MKNSRTALLVALMVVLAVSTVHAASGEGVGVRTCDFFTKNYKADPSVDEVYFSWAQGFMSGLNISRLNDTSNGFESMSMEKQKEYLRNFCDANPTKKYFEAVGNLYVTLYPRQQ